MTADLIALPPRDRDGVLRVVIEAFFLSVTLLEGKDVKFLGWDGAAAADALIDRSRGAG